MIGAERARTAILRARQRMLEGLVEERTDSLQKMQGELHVLLDNAEQGFLTIGADLRVGGQYSAACVKILGQRPEGQSVLSLLFQEMPESRIDTQKNILDSIFRDSNDLARNLKIELLVKEAHLGATIVEIAYKWVPGRGQLVLVLSDVTETRTLTAAVERERKRQEMIVLAVTESREFIEVAQDYRAFLESGMQALADSSHGAELYRRIHTYKGLLAQFSYFHSPARLHEVESELADCGCLDRPEEVAAGLLKSLDRDLRSISAVLGPEYLTRGGRITLTREQIEELKLLAREAMTVGTSPLMRLIDTLSHLGALDVKAALALQSRGVQALAARLGKEVLPIEITGDAAKLPDESHTDFFRSLVHVFRNAVDHGIEPPEERVAAGKPEAGQIACSVEDHGDRIDIVITDDGCGIDRDALERHWVAAGHDAARAQALSLDELVFADGLSTREEASDVSGRGIGMAAVLGELKKVGGSVALSTRHGEETRLVFSLPRTQ